MCDASQVPATTLVLILEDCPTDAELVSRSVRRTVPGAAIHTAWDRASYLRALSTFEPALVLSDYGLPDITGAEALALAREHAPRAVTIAVTATVNEEAAVACMRAGALDYVLKDDLERLPQALRAALEVRRSRLAATAAEQRTREAEERLRLILEHASDLILLLDPTGRVVFANTACARLRGADRWLDIVLPDDRERVQAVFARALATPRQWSLEHRAAAVDGATVQLEVVGRPVLGAGGEVAQMLIVCRDVTERKLSEEALRRSQEQLRQSQKMDAVGQLAGGIAHDFNNLLTAIIGFAELLQQQLPPGGKQEEHTRQIRRAGERAAALTRQLLAFGRRHALAPQRIDLNLRVRDMAVMLRRLIGEDVTFHLELTPAPLTVELDPTGLEQIVLNLAVNARGAMAAGGRLTIGTRETDLVAPLAAARGEVPAGSWVELEVCDTGSGMEPDTLSHLFEPFFTTKPPGEGTGLGLATVYGLVTQSGGHILVDSAIGRGTRFRVFLPRGVGPAVSVNRSSPHGNRLGAGRVLLVEDDESVRAFTATVLREAGYVVLDAATACEALTLAASTVTPVDVVVSDVVMPDVSGPELVRRLRTARPGLPAVLVTGYSTDRLAAELDCLVAESGLTPTVVLRKPFGRGELLEWVAEVLADRSVLPAP